MRARDALLTVLFAAAGAYGAWNWWSRRAPEPAPQHSTTQPSFAAPELSEAEAPRRELGAIESRKNPAQAGSGVPLELARRNSEGIDALELGELARAIALFEGCLAARPDEKIFAENLAEALARKSNLDFDSADDEERAQALLGMRRALELAPARKDIELRLSQMERLAKSEAGFWKDSSEHFELSYDGERSDLLGGAFQITPQLERAYQQYGELFDTSPVEKGRPKIRVVLYRREGFHEATGIGHWAGGLFDGTVRVPVEDMQKEKLDLERVLRHEIAHAFVSSAGGAKVPGWLNEGLAQYLEYENLSARATRVQNARSRLRGKPLLPLAELQKSLADLADDEKIQLAYSEGLALVEAIERNYGERVPYQMVSGCKQQVSVADTFHSRTGQALESALSDLALELER
jgi:tetratricopeptide (TPR) repeat protein